MSSEGLSSTASAVMVRAGILSGLVMGSAGLPSTDLEWKMETRAHTTIYPTFDKTRGGAMVSAFSSSDAEVVSARFPRILEGFYQELAAAQEPLGTELEAVLANKLWDLYVS